MNLSAIPSTLADFRPLPGLNPVAGETSPPGATVEAGAAPSAGGAAPAGESFSAMLGRLVSDVNASQNAAAQSVSALQGGQNQPLHQTMISMEEANLSFQLMVEVRNRLLESYQEIMRMQV